MTVVVDKHTARISIKRQLRKQVFNCFFNNHLKFREKLRTSVAFVTKPDKDKPSQKILFRWYQTKLSRVLHRKCVGGLKFQRKIFKLAVKLLPRKMCEWQTRLANILTFRLYRRVCDGTLSLDHKCYLEQTSERQNERHERPINVTR